MGRLSKSTAVFAVVAATALGAGTGTAFADKAYPPGPEQLSGSTFSGDQAQWTDIQHECIVDLSPLPIQLPLGAISPLACTVANTYEGADGKPAGSIKTTYNSVAGLLNLLTGTGTWQSPSFTLEGTPTGGLFSYDRKALIAGLIAIGGTANATVNLYDETAGGLPIELVNESLDEASSDFQVTPPTKVLTKEQLVGGHKYHLTITTKMSSLLQAASNPIAVLYDNVKLLVADGTGDGTTKALVTTLTPTDITDTSVLIKGAIDAKASQSYYQFDLGETGADYTTHTTRKSGGNASGPKEQSESITGLAKCKSYHFRMRGANTVNVADPLNDATQDTLGNDVTFSTWCAPSATTLPAGPLSATTAGLNAVINPNGPATTYTFEWGPTTAYGNKAPATPGTIGAGMDNVSVTEPLAGLSPTATYHYRIVAANKLGITTGQDQVFTLPQQSGPGPTGSTGATGATGTPGKNGKDGKSDTNITLANGDERGLLIIRSRVARIGLKGSRAGQVRLPIFCKKETGRSCAGTVKIRTTGKINPASFGKAKPKRKVTFITFEYQLAAGKKGYAIARAEPEKLRLMRKIRTVKVDISVQVTDSNNNRQTIVQKGTFKAQNRV